MNEKQALEDSQLKVFDHNKCAVAYAQGYLEAIEKAKGLAKVLKDILGLPLNKNFMLKFWVFYDKAKEVLVQWGKDK